MLFRSKLQKVDPFFNDPKGEYMQKFERSLEGVTAKNSETKFCIEKYLMKSEKDWFAQRHNAKLGKSVLASPASSIFRVPLAAVRPLFDSGSEDQRRGSDSEADLMQFGLGHDFIPFKGLKRIMQTKIGNWQIYTFFLAFVSFPAPLSCTANNSTGTNYCSEFLSDQPPHRRKR